MPAVRAACVLLAAVACAGAAERSGATQIVASFYPLAFVAQEVGGNLVHVENLTPTGAEPHDLELTPGQVRTLAGADLVVYLGGGFQPSLEDAVDELDTMSLDVLDGQRELLHSEAGRGHADEHGPADPHIWLDPRRVELVARIVGDDLAEIDPTDARTYRTRARKLISRLRKLDAELREGLRRCRRRSFVTSHEAFGYLANAYRLDQVGIVGIDAEAEPSPRRLAEVTRFVKENDVTTIYFEELVPADVAETLAEEAGVDTASLNPLESPPEDGDYFSAMRANLSALRRGLDCS